MNIVCPHCNFSRDVPDAQVPARPVKVTCPKCQQGFSFDRTVTVAASAFDANFTDSPGPAAVPPQEAPTTCPACGLEQPAGEACAGCGVIYAKWAARNNERAASELVGRTETRQPGHDIGTRPRCSTEQSCMSCGAVFVATTAMPTVTLQIAGFWLRFVACLLDSLILGAVQFGIGLAFGLAGGAIIGGDSDSFALDLVTWLCSTVVGVTYYIFFTGYNGQTPGKMALRIQVVRTDGTAMTYRRAFLREVVGKFLSALILGIGYLMAGFDRNKQGLHDRIAGTYVIKL